MKAQAWVVEGSFGRDHWGPFVSESLSAIQGSFPYARVLDPRGDSDVAMVWGCKLAKGVG